MRLLIPRNRLAAVAAALTLTTAAAAGCGSDDTGPEGASASQAPKAGVLLGESLRRMEGQKSAVVSLGMDVAGRSADPKLAPFLGKPISARISGGFSEAALALTGVVEGMGRKERIEARADRARSFVRFGGTWYGPGDGLDRASSASETDPAELRRAVAVLREHGDRVVKGKVVPGPDLDGPTWQVSGPLDADGIIAAARAEGEAPDADETQGLRLIAPLVKVTFAAGREDRLPRRFALRVDLSPEQVQRVRALGGADAEDFPLDELRAGLSLDMTRWGEPVRFQAPADPEPFESLYGAIGGALLAAGG